MESLADGERVAPRDRIRAIDVMAKYGFGAGEASLEDVRHRLGKTLALIRERLPEAQAAALVADLKLVWL